MQRSQKTVSLIYLACAFMAWLILRELVLTIWLLSGISMPADWIFAPSDVIAAAIAIALFVFLVRSRKINEFVNEVLTELGRVVWPERKETVLSTGVVCVLVGLCSVIFFAFDTLWGTVVKVFYR